MCSNHRQLWIEVDNSTILGKHLPSAFSTPRSQLLSEDPRSRKKYTKLAHQEYSKIYVSNYVNQIKGLLTSFNEGNESVKPAIMEAYEDLHLDTSKARLAIESKLQFRYVGQVPWSPKLQRYMDTIDFWMRIVKLRKGVDTSQT